MDGLKFFTILILCAWHVPTANGVKSGPFKSSYTKVQTCPNPTLPIDTDPAATFYGELYNTSTETNVLRGRIVVIREHRIKKMKAKSYLWDNNNNKWKVSYMINNMGCNRVFFPVLVMATGVKYDMKTCTFFKGEYEFSDLNVDKVQHLWMKIQEYGKVLWRIELYSNAGTVFCWEFETIIVPA